MTDTIATGLVVDGKPIRGSHWIIGADGKREICYCGPANYLRGPQWVGESELNETNGE